MKAITRIISSALFVALTGLVVPEEAGAQRRCSSDKDFKLRIRDYSLRLSPENRLKCLAVQDYNDFEKTFRIELIPKGEYELRMDSVHVREVDTKFDGADAVECSDNLSFKDPEYSNNDRINYVEVTIVGEDAEKGDAICFDIEVDGVGTLDPRAQVTDEDALLGNRVLEIRELFDVYEFLLQEELAEPGPEKAFDEYFMDRYEITEDDARNLALGLTGEQY